MEEDVNLDNVDVEKDQPKISVLSKSAISPGNIIISSKYNRNNIKSEIFKEARSSCKYSDPPTIGTHREHNRDLSVVPSHQNNTFRGPMSTKHELRITNSSLDLLKGKQTVVSQRDGRLSGYSALRKTNLVLDEFKI
jgi:hypothetical protein